ncbi:hypothetical protein VTK73DRAFT_4370 [Phialemonium thermophilum]|uniref:DUF1917 domain-containing protein n=1 Tax=Phialemonium thermophilum TaxID=223376 RepID=A0ABR3XZB1_9PEZI
MDSDSDFYGEDEMVAELEARVDSLDVKSWWQVHGLRRNAGIRSSDEEELRNVELYNPYAGVRFARQLCETVDEFLARLPPRSTDVTPALEWIFICNPHIPDLQRASAGDNTICGGEVEAPVPYQARLVTFVEGGTERLHLLRNFIDECTSSNRPKALVAAEIVKARDEAVRDILTLSHVLHVRSGKWMLFPDPEDVDAVWRIVAEATANNELGVAAKVAPRVKETPSRARLLCVYTRDFIDKSDIGRVLRRMRELGLVKPGRRQIYYKCDAYTYLGIGAGNIWGIKPSLYASNDFFNCPLTSTRTHGQSS